MHPTSLDLCPCTTQYVDQAEYYYPEAFCDRVHEHSVARCTSFARLSRPSTRGGVNLKRAFLGMRSRVGKYPDGTELAIHVVVSGEKHERGGGGLAPLTTSASLICRHLYEILVSFVSSHRKRIRRSQETQIGPGARTGYLASNTRREDKDRLENLEEQPRPASELERTWPVRPAPSPRVSQQILCSPPRCC